MNTNIDFIASFNSAFGDSYCIKIYDTTNKNSRKAKEVTLGSSPILRKQNGDKINGTSLEFSLESKEDAQFAVLYTNNPYKWGVDLYRGDEKLWSGFLATELLSEPDIAPPYDVAFTASDNLALLKRFYTKDYIDFSKGMLISFEDILTSTLKATGLALSLKYMTSLQVPFVFSPDVKATDAFFKDVRTNIFNYKDKTLYDLLAEVLKLLNAKICQYRGDWCVYRTNDLLSLSTGNTLYYGSAAKNLIHPIGYTTTSVEPCVQKLKIDSRLTSAVLADVTPKSYQETTSLVIEGLSFFRYLMDYDVEIFYYKNLQEIKNHDDESFLEHGGSNVIKAVPRIELAISTSNPQATFMDTFRLETKPVMGKLTKSLGMYNEYLDNYGNGISYELRSKKEELKRLQAQEVVKKREVNYYVGRDGWDWDPMNHEFLVNMNGVPAWRTPREIIDYNALVQQIKDLSAELESIRDKIQRQNDTYGPDTFVLAEQKFKIEVKAYDYAYIKRIRVKSKINGYKTTLKISSSDAKYLVEESVDCTFSNFLTNVNPSAGLGTNLYENLCYKDDHYMLTISDDAMSNIKLIEWFGLDLFRERCLPRIRTTGTLLIKKPQPITTSINYFVNRVNDNSGASTAMPSVGSVGRPMASYAGGWGYIARPSHPEPPTPASVIASSNPIQFMVLQNPRGIKQEILSYTIDLFECEFTFEALQLVERSAVTDAKVIYTNQQADDEEN